MRVLICTHNYPRFKGDASGAFIEELVKALPEKGVDPVVLCPHARGLRLEEVRGGVMIRRFRYAPDEKETLAYQGKMLSVFKSGLKGLMLFGSFFNEFIHAVRRLIAYEKVDLVHAHWLLPAGLTARIALRTASTPLIISAHGTDVRLLEAIPSGSLLAGWLLKRTDMVLPVSWYLAKRLESLNRGPLAQKVLPMPASGMFLAPARKTLKKRIAAVGNVTRQKRFDVLIKALGILKREGLRIPLRLVGEGPQRHRLESLAFDQKVEAEFLGRRPHHELAGILRKAGVLVLPSVREGFGMALVEAQLAGLVAVGADSGGQRDIIEDGRTGLLVEPDNPRALAQAIRWLYNNEKKALRMAERGQAYAGKHFLAESLSAELAGIYKRVLR